MADEAILRIVIVDDATKTSRQPIPPEPVASPSGPRQEVPTIQSFATLHTAIEGLTADFARAAISIRQMVSQVQTAAPKYIDVTPPKAIASSSQQNYAGNLQDLMKRMGTTKISANEVQSSFAGANLSKQEQEFLEQIIVQGKKYNAIAGEMGVHPTRVTQIAKSVQGKVGSDETIHKMLLNVEKENKNLATNEQRMGQRVTSENIGAGVSMLDTMQEQEKGGQYGEKVPTWEKLINRLTDASIKELNKSAPDADLIAQIEKASQGLYANYQGDREQAPIPKKVLERARRAKSLSKMLKVLGPHLDEGGIPSWEFGYYDPLDFEEDPDVPGSWMDPEDFNTDWDSIPHAIMDPSTTGPGGSVYSGYARGGRVDLSRGGGVPNTGHAQSGADWHPAWLTDKEFVINARSAARNREALQAANANPDVTLSARHYATGGPTIANILAGAMQATGTGSATSIANLEIAGGPIGQAAMLLLEAQKAFSAQMVGAARGVGEFANALADPDANPAKPLMKAGDSIQAAGDKMHNTIVSVLGESVKQFAGLMDSITGTAKRYGEFSPNIAAAEAVVDIQQTLGDFRRAQEYGPELARYIKAQGDLQQRFEDAKMKLLLKILPAVTTIVDTLEAIMGAGEGVTTVLSGAFAPLVAIAEAAKRIAGATEEANRVEIQDPTEALFQINAIRVPEA